MAVQKSFADLKGGHKLISPHFSFENEEEGLTPHKHLSLPYILRVPQMTAGFGKNLHHVHFEMQN